MITKRALTRTLTPLAAFAFIVSACTSGATPSAATSAAPSAASAAPSDAASEAPSADPLAELVTAAQAEGTLTTIALPHDWCNYGEAIETFKSKYEMEVNELDPNAGSGDEIEAIKANKDNPGPQAPDVIDVGLSFGPSAKAEDLLAQYMVQTWDTIPDDAKDPEGYWWGDYYGVLAFEVNTAVVSNVPQDWPDLLKPEYKGQVALAGDPRVSNQAIQAVYAAGLANGGSLDDASAGLAFFKELNAAGNLLPGIANAATVAAGETPITIRWTYNALANRDTTAASGGPAIEVVVPASGRFAGVYVQGISAFAPHPNAARLWMEYLFSDEAQLAWLAGHCHPIRIADLRRRGTIPLEKFDGAQPLDPDDYQDVDPVFPTLKEQERARDIITNGWDAVVGVEIRCVPQEDEQIPMSFNDTTTCEAPVLQ